MNQYITISNVEAITIPANAATTLSNDEQKLKQLMNQHLVTQIYWFR